MEKQNLTEVASRKPEVTSKTVFKALNDRGFRIPLYQRDYAWGDNEISQLMDDLWHAFERGAKAYYLGTLVVMCVEDGGNILEVVDGQQRLTTLTLLYRWILDNEFLEGRKWEKSPLSFENRPDSESAIKLFIQNKEAQLNHEKLSESIRIIAKEERKIKDNLKQQKKDWTSFQTFLKENVKIFQVTLPSHTDVAAYFEVMNNRGRQLEAHEILKAKLMSKIEKTKHEDFAERWDACNWDSEENKKKKEAEEKAKKEDTNVSFRLIKIKNKEGEDVDKNNEGKDDNKFTLVSFGAEEDVKWRPRIKFPELLSIALSCYVTKEGLEAIGDLKGRVFSEQRLNDDFNAVEETLQKKEKSKEDETGKKFAGDFLKVLEEVRALFDRYVIYFCNEEGKIQWSLKEVAPVKDKLTNTFGTIGQDKDENPSLQEQIVHLQSMLEVSGISWIRDFMVKFMEKLHVSGDKEPEWDEDKKPELARKIRDWLETFVKERPSMRNLKTKIEELKGKNDSEARASLLGMLNYDSRPLLALNVLDYLFRKEGNTKDKDFVFRYRNSIEHFYPQDDKLCKGEEWIGDEKNLFLNCIGNLYLTTGKENSKLSNYSPSAKIDLWDDKSSPMTPKQRRMYDVARKEKEGGKKCWTAKDCEDHAKVCWRMLAEFLGVPLPRDSPSTPAAIKDDPDTPSTGEGGNVGGGETASAESAQPSN